MKKVYIVGAKRTPIGKFKGGLSSFSAADLGSFAIQGLIDQTKIKPEDVDQVIIGNVLQAGQGQNPARKASRLAGIPESVPAITINDVCGSGLSSINMSAALIMSGQADVIVAGGMESMSNAPYVLDRNLIELDNPVEHLEDTMLKDGLQETLGGYHMGITAENIKEEFSVSRQEMDQFAFDSHMKAQKATEDGLFKQEIVEIKSSDEGNMNVINTDETIRPNTNIEKLANLKPAFKEDGEVTAGNSSSLNDGASVVMLASQEAVERLDLTPLAEWVDSSLVGVKPELMGIGPIKAINKLLSQQQMNVNDIDLVEINEAFASQAIADIKELGIDNNKVNPKGGAIALGHPIGASGSRILTTLVYEMIENKSRYGVASLCVGGGMGVATLIKSV